jgi:hypothetical protein
MKKIELAKIKRQLKNYFRDVNTYVWKTQEVLKEEKLCNDHRA